MYFRLDWSNVNRSFEISVWIDIFYFYDSFTYNQMPLIVFYLYYFSKIYIVICIIQNLICLM